MQARLVVHSSPHQTLSQRERARKSFDLIRDLYNCPYNRVEKTLRGQENEYLLRENDLCSRENDLCTRENDLCRQETDLCTRENDLCSRENDLCTRENDLCSRENDLCKRENDFCRQENDLCRLGNDFCEQESDVYGQEGISAGERLGREGNCHLEDAVDGFCLKSLILSFTRGFSPVITGQKIEEPFQRFLLSQVTEAFECEGVTSPAARGNR
jgi:hypothetical protein